MDSRITMALAGLLVLGALFAGYWGIVLSRQAPSESLPVDGMTSSAENAGNPRVPVVVAVRTLAPFVPVSADDLAIEQLRAAPVGSFAKIDDVVGRTPWNAVAAGSWLSEGSFSSGGPLAQMIKPSERAVAIAVDEIVGSGGHLSPGDYVDVLLYMRDDGAGQSQGAQSAQVAVPALRLLSFGEQLGPDREGKAVATGAEPEGERRSSVRSVVLAVPEEWVTRLMLASQAGSLRLAVRSSEEHAQRQAAEHPQASLDERTRSLLRLDQLGGRSATAAPVATPTAPHTGPRRSSQVEVVRGNTSTFETP